MEYKILKETNAFTLQTTVNKFIADGWIPLGGISISRGYYGQAIIKNKIL